jgi:LysM repeat protein
MRSGNSSLRLRRVLPLSVLSAIAVSAVGCSSNPSRFSDNPTGSVYPSDARADHVAVAPILPPERPLPPPTAADVTGTSHAGGASSSWDRQGVTPIIVAPGETIDTIARKYGVPVHAIMNANAITNPTTIAPGQHLVIPRYTIHDTGAELAHATAPRNAVAAAAHATRAGVAASPIPAVPSSSAVHLVAHGDTLITIARKHRVTLRALIAANAIRPETPLKVGMKLTIPTQRVAVPVPKNKPIKVGQAP